MAGCKNLYVMTNKVCKHKLVPSVGFAGFLWQLLLTNLTLEAKVLWDFVQTNHGCVSNFPKDVGEDAGGFGARGDRRKKIPQHDQRHPIGSIISRPRCSDAH